MILTVLAFQLLLPVHFVLWSWRGRDPSRVHWIVKILLCGVFLGYLFHSGRWDWLSYYLRYVFMALFAGAAFLSFRHVRSKPLLVIQGRLGWLRLGAEAVVIAVFVFFLALVWRAHVVEADPVHLAFPLRDGTYYVAHGGSNPIMNYHNRYEPQAFALDITRLNAWGTRARGLYPRDLERYEIYGDLVHAPCGGDVVAAADGLPDQVPSRTDDERPAGNHVAIACRGVTVVLAHLQRGSVLVRIGDDVDEGQPIGRVGNSGHTTEPHLHIHAMRGRPKDVLRGSPGMPILFDGRFLTRNDLFVGAGPGGARAGPSAPARSTPGVNGCGRRRSGTGVRLAGPAPRAPGRPAGLPRR